MKLTDYEKFHLKEWIDKNFPLSAREKVALHKSMVKYLQSMDAQDANYWLIMGWQRVYDSMKQIEIL